MFYLRKKITIVENSMALGGRTPIEIYVYMYVCAHWFFYG